MGRGGGELGVSASLYIWLGAAVLAGLVAGVWFKLGGTFCIKPDYARRRFCL